MANCLVCRVSARSFQSRDNGITFHRFPATRSVICARWKKFAGLAEDYNVKSKRLCSRHFRADDFVNKSPFRKNLRCGAVPTLCHPTNTPSEGSELASAPAPLEDDLNGSEGENYLLHPHEDDGKMLQTPEVFVFASWNMAVFGEVLSVHCLKNGTKFFR